jgi:hypothetical protein
VREALSLEMTEAAVMVDKTGKTAKGKSRAS